MPDSTFYDGLPIADALQRFAEEHYKPETRHISRGEYEMLLRAVEALRRDI